VGKLCGLSDLGDVVARREEMIAPAQRAAVVHACEIESTRGRRCACCDELLPVRRADPARWSAADGAAAALRRTDMLRRVSAEGPLGLCQDVAVRNPGCWANALDDCRGALTAEHLISVAVWAVPEGRLQRWFFKTAINNAFGGDLPIGAPHAQPGWPTTELVEMVFGLRPIERPAGPARRPSHHDPADGLRSIARPDDISPTRRSGAAFFGKMISPERPVTSASTRCAMRSRVARFRCHLCNVA
jgi:hypothetical protein